MISGAIVTEIGEISLRKMEMRKADGQIRSIDFNLNSAVG